MSNTLSSAIDSLIGKSVPKERSYKYKSTNKYSDPNYFKCGYLEQGDYLSSLNTPITIAHNIKQREGEVMRLSDIISIVTSPSNKGIEKINRRVIYSTSNGERPISDNAYSIWNGFQIIDMDIKDESIAKALKPIIFDSLNHFPWFFGVVLSSSGRGLHVMTKIAMPEKRANDIKVFRVNFRQKYSLVYMACLKVLGRFNKTKNDLQSWMDISMFKPQQGAFIGYDDSPLFSTHFFEDFLYIDFDKDIEWSTHKDLKDIFARWEFFDDIKPESVDIIDKGSVDIKNKVHYKHQQRWRLANTLVAIYGKDLGYSYLRSICSDKVSDDELKAICATAYRHSKGADENTINLLNTKHGFNIKTKKSVHEVVEVSETIDNPNMIFPAKETVELFIKKDEYLGHISERIESEVQNSWVSILEAGPGLGKTEFVKSLAKNKKVMLVMPFTSTIQSKTEQEDHFRVAYGDKIINLNFNGGMATTIDKFSRLDPLDVNMAGYDYIFVDESHLLFISNYRDVMGDAINLINNIDVPVILMTGTPTGEFVFFKEAKHIKVLKEDHRMKSLELRIVGESADIIPRICFDMFEDYKMGNRVLFPTNRGTKYARSIEAGINLLCDGEGIDRPNIEYYKRSNMGDKFMDTINKDATIEDIDILMCTSFLSVGVDILDRLDFRIYFSDVCLPAEYDQWCNRLRNNDLISRLYIALLNSDGVPNQLTKWVPADFNEKDEDVRMAIDIVNLCNDYLSREGMLHQYNGIINRVLADNRYIQYDTINNKYKVDPIAFALFIYEDRLRKYCMQLPVFIKGMSCYGYGVEVNELDSLGAMQITMTEEIKQNASIYKDEQTSTIDDMLDDLTPEMIGVFGDVLKNKMSLKKGEFSIKENELTIPNVEVFNKVAPHIISLYRRFDVEEIRDIFDFVKKDHYNFAELGRLRTLFSILDSEESNTLDIQFRSFMDEVRVWVEDSGGIVSKDELKEFIDTFIQKNHNIQSQRAWDKIYDIYLRVLKCIVNVRITKKMVQLSLREMLWKTRMNKLNKVEDFILNEFIDQYIVCQTKKL